MWNLGMAEIPKASRENFIQIMKVFTIPLEEFLVMASDSL
jgi:hypothetical protein